MALFIVNDEYRKSEETFAFNASNSSEFRAKICKGLNLDASKVTTDGRFDNLPEDEQDFDLLDDYNVISFSCNHIEQELRVEKVKLVE